LEKRALEENQAQRQRHGTSKFLVDLLQLRRNKVEIKDAVQEEHMQLFEGLEIPLS
jgi:hypothetical protein